MIVLYEASNEQNHDYNFGSTCKYGGFGAGLQWLHANDSVPANELDAYRLWVSYGNKTFSMGQSCERLDMATTGREVPQLGRHIQRDRLAEAGHRLRQGRRQQLREQRDGKGVTAGVFYKLFGKTELCALYSNVDPDTGQERKTLAFGLNQKFTGASSNA